MEEKIASMPVSGAVLSFILEKVHTLQRLSYLLFIYCFLFKFFTCTTSLAKAGYNFKVRANWCTCEVLSDPLNYCERAMSGDISRKEMQTYPIHTHSGGWRQTKSRKSGNQTALPVKLPFE